MNSDIALVADGLSKKFCRSLKKSLWYGVSDLAAEFRGGKRDRRLLRPDEFWVVSNVSFDLRKGETLALIGPNGAGKSSLLRLLNGLIKPDLGSVAYRGKMQALIALGAGFNPILSGRENIYINAAVLGMPKAEVTRRFDEIIDFSGVEEFIDSPVKNYSSGMQVRLGFAVAAHLDPDILLVDEVLAVGDEGFQAKCLNKIGSLRRDGTALILVSHNMHTISSYSDRVLLKTKDNAVLYESVDEGVREYKALFRDADSSDVEKHVSGVDGFQVDDVEFSDMDMAPGDDFTIRIDYSALKSYNNIEVDTTVRSTTESSTHFQATNKSFSKRLSIDAGTGSLRISLRSLRLQNCSAIIGVAVWAEGRNELLFWWRIPVQFAPASLSSGTSHYLTEYQVGERVK
jgi:lipopolysaccharide transport system ATP-binding protein